MKPFITIFALFFSIAIVAAQTPHGKKVIAVIKNKKAEVQNTDVITQQWLTALQQAGAKNILPNFAKIEVVNNNNQYLLIAANAEGNNKSAVELTKVRNKLYEKLVIQEGKHYGFSVSCIGQSAGCYPVIKNGTAYCKGKEGPPCTKTSTMFSESMFH